MVLYTELRALVSMGEGVMMIAICPFSLLLAVQGHIRPFLYVHAPVRLRKGGFRIIVRLTPRLTEVLSILGDLEILHSRAGHHVGVYPP